MQNKLQLDKKKRSIILCKVINQIMKERLLNNGINARHTLRLFIYMLFQICPLNLTACSSPKTIVIIIVVTKVSEWAQ